MQRALVRVLPAVMVGAALAATALPNVTIWKEQGRTPDAIVVSHRAGGVEDRTMLVCPYPQVAAYNGTGSARDAANFACRGR